MQDVARAAKVHQSTVSLALRNDPRLKEETRREIQALAERLGYRPDPLLSALINYRFGRQPVKAPTTMAFLLHFRDRAELEASHPHRLFLDGARRQAEKIGYQLEIFYVGAYVHGADQRIERILKARGIDGVILAAFGQKLTKFEMNWADFSVVRIESHQLERALHVVSSHQLEITREAVRRLYEFGYRRIGLAVGERGEVNLRSAFTAGYFIESSMHPDAAYLPRLLLPLGASAADIVPPLDQWVKQHKIEVVVSNWPIVMDALRLTKRRVPEDIVVASLDLHPDLGPNAGMRQNHRVVGERAVDQLAILMRTNQRGCARPHNNTLIEGDWVDGSDVPPRRVRPTKARARAAAR